MSSGMGPHHDEAWLKSLGKYRKDWGKPKKPRESIRDRTIANQYRDRERDKLLRLQNLERRQQILDGLTAGESAILNTTGLIGFWPMQEPSGDLIDVSTFARDIGVVTGADGPHPPHNIWQVDGPTENVPYGIEFDPSGYAVHTNTPQAGFGRANVADFGIGATSSFSIEFWYKPDASGSDACTLVGMLNSGGNGKGWYVWAGSGSGRLTPTFSRIDAAFGEDDVSAASPLTAGSWSHICCIYDGATMGMYINGVLSATHASTRSVYATTIDLSIAYALVSAGTQVTHLTGALSFLAIYNVVLSEQEIRDHYLLGKQGTSSTPVDFPIFAANPTDPASGYAYLNSVDGTVRVFDGSGWLTFASGGPTEIDIPLATSNPLSPANGRTYYNTSADELRLWDGSAWQAFTPGAQSLEVFENGS